MKTILHIVSFEWKMLWRSNVLKVLLAVVFFSGIYGIYFGEHEVNKQRQRIAEVQQFEREQFDSLLVWAALDTTSAEYKGKYEAALSPTGAGWNKHFTYYEVKNPTPMAGLCLGQSDLYPSYYGFNVTDLARQVNSVELANPLKLLTGNFDLSYVFIFLFPLLIIALFYDMYASEKDGGTLQLLRSQPTGLGTVFLARSILRLLMVWVFATILLVTGFLIQGISIGENFNQLLQWNLIIYAYSFFWVLIIGIIVRLKRSGALSAMLGLGVWLIFTLVMPAVLNLFVLAKEPVPNRSDMIHALRNMNDAHWEKPKSYVLDQFYVNNPEFNDGDTVDFYKWYYAGFALIDEQANLMNSEFEKQVVRRNSLLDKWIWMAPAAYMHEELAGLSGTDRSNHMMFMDEVKQFHTDLKSLYYQRIFDGQKFSEQDLKDLEKRL